ncbi:MAG: OST-HTH/LOTUS domain-containing protein [Cypionkella sp.]|uniref:OST-HTH/LOTUS domain-containing protein n=1 Tax=Cypionkella sp. TaxID=2811411 RepID=UPI002ABAEABA|nr:OST-HTH/LOTUS domain-containing protein [Cypionkella sp.]MDZ4312083.1 OST-HTH/LOTUS domain-containing protein [Cypionkella sp.]
MTPEGTALSAQRGDVERLYGHCVLLLQAFELNLKAVVATHRFSGAIGTFEVGLARRFNETRRKTMGSLVGEMLGSVLAPSGQEGLPDTEDNTPGTSVAFSRQIVLPTEAFSRIEGEHRDLVALRNSLVHNFLEEHDLRSVKGCLMAQQALASVIYRVKRADDQLAEWTTDWARVGEILTEKLNSPKIRDWIITGRIPWPSTIIVQALLDAATELAPGGWASVKTAAALVARRHPDERPENYGCRTWRQVIHKSGLFNLRSVKIDGRGHARYRARPKI